MRVKPIKLFWSNICVLHRYEKLMLEKAKERLEHSGIKLEITYFGIGYPKRMSEYLMEEGAVIPDMIVSTDLEVFEDPRIFGKFSKNLHPLQEIFEIKKELLHTNVNWNLNLIPFLVIPLVICSSFEGIEKDISFKQLLSERDVCFGGINNSGARSLLKALWSCFGKDKVVSFAKSSQIEQMPIGAFHQVKTGRSRTSICPSIYAKTADGKSLKRYYPEEGAVALPSYISAGKNIQKDVVIEIFKVIFTKEFCDYFVKEGDLYSGLTGSKENDWVSANGSKFLYPSAQYFASVSPEEFERTYKSIFTHKL